MPPPVQDVALAVKRLQWRHHTEAGRRLAAIGVSLPQWDVLRHLRLRPDASLHDLARSTFQTDQAMGTLAARMAARGLIERVAGPGRAVHHELTAQGERVRAAGSDIVDQVFAETIGRLTAEERTTLLALLHRADEPSPAS